MRLSGGGGEMCVWGGGQRLTPHKAKKKNTNKKTIVQADENCY